MSTPTTTADSIEFHCTGCGRNLKVPASAAGKRASCPQCNTVVQVPAYQSERLAPASTPAPIQASARSASQPEAPARNSPASPSVAWALPPQPPAAPPPPQAQAPPTG